MQVFQMFVAWVTSKKIEFGTENGHRMGISRHWYQTRNLGLNPGESVQVQYFDIIKTFVAIIATKHVQFAPDSRHRMAGASTRSLLPRNLWFTPHQTHCVEHVKIIEPLVAVMSPVEVDLVPVHGSSMVIATSWLRAESFWLGPAH